MNSEENFNDFQKKAFDLCLAVYRVVDLFPRSEVLGDQIKQITASLTADVLTIERVGGQIPLNIPASLVKNLFDDLSLSIIRNADKLIGYFQIAREQEWVNSANFELLIKQYQEIVSYLKSRESILMPRQERVEAFYPAASEEVGYAQPRTVKAASPYPARPKPAQPRNNNNRKDLNQRQKRIVDFLKKHGEAKMADFLGVFKNEVTERTLRNDLRDLTEQGLIRAEGEYKTRRYFIS